MLSVLIFNASRFKYFHLNVRSFPDANPNAAASLPVLYRGFWFLTGLLTLFVGIVNASLPYEIIGVLTMIMVTALINGSRWSFWSSAIFLAFNFGMRLLQLQISSWRLNESDALVWGSLILSSSFSSSTRSTPSFAGSKYRQLKNTGRHSS